MSQKLRTLRSVLWKITWDLNFRQGSSVITDKNYIPRIVCSIAAALPCGIAYQNFGAPK